MFSERLRRVEKEWLNTQNEVALHYKESPFRLS